jgi:hypothetical protein
MFIEEFRKKFIEREREIVDMRMEILEKQKVIRDKLVQRSEEDVKHLKHYYEKKVCVF